MAESLAETAPIPLFRPQTWLPGQTGNPVGNRNKAILDITHYALSYAPRAMALLMQIAEEARDPKTKILAITALLDRGLGKPTQRQEHTGEGGGPITVTIGIKESHTPAIHHTDLPITPLISTTADE